VEKIISKLAISEMVLFDELSNKCYELKFLELDKRTHSYIRINTRELDRELFTK